MLYAAIRALSSAGAALSAAEVVKDSQGTPIEKGDVVRPDYKQPGWRLKTLKRGVVQSVSPGRVQVEWSSQVSGVPGRMLIVEKKAGAKASAAVRTWNIPLRCDEDEVREALQPYVDDDESARLLFYSLESGGLELPENLDPERAADLVEFMRRRDDSGCLEHAAKQVESYYAMMNQMADRQRLKDERRQVLRQHRDSQNSRRLGDAQASVKEGDRVYSPMAGMSFFAGQREAITGTIRMSGKVPWVIIDPKHREMAGKSKVKWTAGWKLLEK